MGQDPKGVEGHRLWQEGLLEVWVKPVADGGMAVGVFNRGTSALPVHFKDTGLPNTVQIRDLWARKNLGRFQGSYTASVPRPTLTILTVDAARRSAA